MALIAEIVKVPGKDKYAGPTHLPGRTTRIFANPVMPFTDTVRRRDSVANHFSGICNWLI
jgi:hypothetical protein